MTCHQNLLPIRPCNTDVTFIELVQQHKCLYDYLAPGYNKKDYVDDVWKQVASAMDLSVQECKDKWKNIRSSYVRALKKNKRSYYLAPFMEFIKPYIRKCDGNRQYPDGADQTKEDTIEPEEFPFQNAAEFNDTESSDSGDEAPVVTIKLEPDPIASHSDENIDYEPQAKVSKCKIEQRRRPQKKRKVPTKKSKVEMGTRNDEGRRDAMRFFLLSLLPEFDAMGDDQLREFKIKVLTLINEIKENSSGEDE